MSPSDQRDHWQAVYGAKPSTQMSWYQEEAATSLDLARAVLIDHSAAVADVGGGASPFVDGLLADGFTDVTVLDLSSAALDVARERLGPKGDGVKWVAGDVLDWEPARAFALWHDRAVLHFLTDPSDQVRYAELVARAVAPGGHAVIGTFAIGGPTHCSGLRVEQYDDDKLGALLGASFDVVQHLTEEHLTPSGATQLFHWSVLRRRATRVVTR